MKADIELKTNENKYIEFTIEEYDESRFDMDGMVATIQVQKYGDSSLSTSTSCNITDATEGECRWLYDGSLVAGDYTAEIEFTVTANDQRYVTPDFEIEVIQSLAR